MGVLLEQIAHLSGIDLNYCVMSPVVVTKLLRQKRFYISQTALKSHLQLGRIQIKFPG